MPTRSQAASLRDHPTPGSFARPAGHGTLTVLHSSVSGGCEGDQGGSQPQGPPRSPRRVSGAQGQIPSLLLPERVACFAPRRCETQGPSTGSKVPGKVSDWSHSS